MIYSQLTEINIILFNFINHNLQNSFFDFLMPLITNIGSGVFLISISILLLLYGIKIKNKRIAYLAIAGILAIVFTSLTIGIIKVLINEPRPFITLDSVRLLVVENDPYSFPSGHTGNIFAYVIALGLCWKINIKNKSIKLVWLLVPLAFIIGFSRIYIGVHYPFDVIVGSIIGIIAGFSAIKITDYLNKHQKKLKNIEI